MNNDPLNILDEAATQPPNPPQQNDDLANQEYDAKFAENKRGESYKYHIHVIVIIFMYVIGFVFIIMLIIRAWDFVAPDNMRWLSEREDHDLERIVFSGIIISVASKYFKKYNIVESS